MINLIPTERDDDRRVWEFRCDTPEQHNGWVSALGRACSADSDGSMDESELDDRGSFKKGSSTIGAGAGGSSKTSQAPSQPSVQTTTFRMLSNPVAKKGKFSKSGYFGSES